LIPALREAAALVYTDDLDEPALSPADEHHLADVLRLRDGERVVAADGRGGYRLCSVARLASGRRAEVVLRAAGERAAQPAPSPRLTVAFALQKGDRADWTVQKLTELGVDAILPLLSERTVVRLDGAERPRRGERLRKVAREAGAQSRRLHLPEVADPQPFDELVAALGSAARLAEPAAAGGLEGCDTVLVGPEGGWSAAELGCGLATVGLGETVLRAETAAIVSGTLLAAARAGLVAPIGGEVVRPRVR